MRAAMYYSNSDVRLVQLPEPAIGKDEALLRVEASGICGTDCLEWYRRDKVPLVLGHEVAGILVSVGKKVKKFRVGDRVVATHHVPCEWCAFCRDGHETVCDLLRQTHFEPGGFCEFLRLPAVNLKKGTFKIPDQISFAEATFVEPLGCALRGQRLARMRPGKNVLVIGSGMAGLLHIKIAKYHHARRIVTTDVDPFRLEVAQKCGAHAVIPAQENVVAEVKRNFHGKLADLVILCTGVQTAIEQGLRSVERGGTVLVFTAAAKDALLPVSLNDLFWRSELTILSSYAAAPKDLAQALRVIAKKNIKVKDLITHHLPLTDIQKGFDLTVRPQNSVKVIIYPQR